MFSKLSIYFKGCSDVYQILVKQVDDLIIPAQIFNKLQQYLARIRLNLSSIMFTFKSYKKNYEFDEQLLNKSPIEAYSMDFKTSIVIKKKPPVPKPYERGLIIEKDISERINSQILIKPNEEKERIKRLNGVLKQEKEETSFEKKKNEDRKRLIKDVDLNSKILDKLMKYCPKDVRNKIISQRIIEKYKENNSDEEDEI